jgi:hypothetical protein
MSDFLHRLAARALGDGPVVQPRVPTIFAPDDGLERRGAPSEWSGRAPALPLETGFRETDGDARQATLAQPIEPIRADSPRCVDAASPIGTDPSRDAIRVAIDDAPLLPSIPIEPFGAQAGPTQTVDSVPTRAGNRLEPATVSLASAEIPPAAPRRDAGPPQAASAQERPLIASLPLPTRHLEPARRESQPPVIRVTIGRIDVRADFPAPAAHDATTRKARSTARSLDDYLKERIEGKR